MCTNLSVGKNLQDLRMFCSGKEGATRGGRGKTALAREKRKKKRPLYEVRDDEGNSLLLTTHKE